MIFLSKGHTILHWSQTYSLFVQTKKQAESHGLQIPIDPNDLKEAPKPTYSLDGR